MTCDAIQMYRWDALQPCLADGNKASKGGEGPHIGDVYCIVPGTLHVGNVPRFRGVQSTPGLYLRNEHHFYKMLTEGLRWPQSHQIGQ